MWFWTPFCSTKPRLYLFCHRNPLMIWEFAPQWKSIFKYPFFATQSTPTHHHKMRYNVRILFCDKCGHVRKVYLMRMMLFCIKKRFSLSIPIPGVKAIHTHTKPRARAIRITGRNLLIVFLRLSISSTSNTNGKTSLCLALWHTKDTKNVRTLIIVG